MVISNATPSLVGGHATYTRHFGQPDYHVVNLLVRTIHLSSKCITHYYIYIIYITLFLLYILLCMYIGTPLDRSFEFSLSWTCFVSLQRS